MPDPAVRLVAQRFLALTKLATLAQAQPLAALTGQPTASPPAAAMPTTAPARTPGVLPPLASIFPQKPPTSGLKAVGLPGMPGHSATNVIDQMGGLNASGMVVDGNNGAGISKGSAANKRANEADALADPRPPTMRGWQWKTLQRDENENANSWLPRLFSSESTPLVEMLASPARQGLLHALAGGAAGAAAGYYGGQAAGAQPLQSALAGGGLGALLTGVYGYGKRRRENDQITDALRRTPPGATVGDYARLKQQDLLSKTGFSLSRYLETGEKKKFAADGVADPVTIAPRFPPGADQAVSQLHEPGFYNNFSPGRGRADILDPIFRSLGEPGMAVYRQLPRVRLLDSVLGGGLGATAGIGVNAVRNLFRDKEEKKKNPGYGTAALLGGLAGAAGGNVIGDRARRYLSNVMVPEGYTGSGGTTGPDSPVERVMPRNLSDLWRGAVLDEPVYKERDTDATKRDATSTANVEARHELMRRELGVHTNDPTNDIWARNRDSSFSLNPANSNFNRYQGLAGAPLSTESPQDAVARINSGAMGGSTWPFSGVVGGQRAAVFPYEDGQQLVHQRDRWDYTLDPAERSYLYNGLWHGLRNPGWLSETAPAAARDAYTPDSSNRNLLGSLGARELMDRGLVFEQPWISHYNRFTPRPGGGYHNELLTGDGRPYPAAR